MIKAQFFKVDDNYCGFSISGHAGYAERGHDIVCASVSSAVQMAANTVTEIIGADAAVKNVNGTISLKLDCNSGEKTESAMSVIAGLRLHLLLLSKQYKGTISVYDTEV
ncbi:hypothetical protein CCDG5_1218 [[Clostridium] cellulosi]|uniref:Ribosomal processing cysteine protease Prp n=1 Tax=[Clostridium] cellulosi TaxID=29343 RepID=A0A078KPA0_9FIRM|nr:hypothetical protein CCDG5_1218 [[Clostridium] cellulosi]